jgi:undecaprenyl-diphosphatase
MWALLVTKQPSKKEFTVQKRNFIILLIALCLSVALMYFQFDDLRSSVAAIRGANYPLFIVAIVFSLGTFIPAALVYALITPKKLPFRRTLLVQTASSFTGKLLPAGSGGLATFTRYLVRQGHSVADATALASVNNALGFIGLMLITIIAAYFSHSSLRDSIAIHLDARSALVAGGLLLALVLTVLLIPRFLKIVKRYVRALGHDIRQIAASPLRLLLALISSMTITLFFAGVLYVSIYAFGATATILQTVVVLTLSVAAASVTPTPGGVGAAEAGLVAGLVAIGIAADTALAISLIYRLASFWLPMIPGFIAFQYALKKQLL